MNRHFPYLGILLLFLSIHLHAQTSTSFDQLTPKGGGIISSSTTQLRIVYFDVDATEINAKSKAILNKLYTQLKNNERLSIKIDGHSNGNCDDEFCEQLANERAEVVAFYLMELGLRSHRIDYAGYGKQKPRANNRTREGKRKNQRVEISIVNN